MAITQISQMRRMTLVDKVLNSSAELLSLDTYPSAIFFGEPPTVNEDPNIIEKNIIWKGGKPYGIHKVNTTPVIIDSTLGIGIALGFDEKGALCLKLVNVTNEFFYIGSYAGLEITDDNNIMIPDNSITRNYSEEGWHWFSNSLGEFTYRNNYGNDEYAFEITDINDFCVAIPFNYSLCLDMTYFSDINDETTAEYVSDSHAFDNGTRISVNGKEYIIYKFAENLTPIYFIDIIKKIQ